MFATKVESAVFIKSYPTHSEKTLHVMVGTANWTVKTVLLPKKNHHGKVLWTATSLKPEVAANYDKVADVLYVFKNEPVPALTDEGDDGLLLRYAIDDDRPVGITVPSYQEVWEPHVDTLIDKISDFLNVSSTAARHALEHAK